MVSSISVIGVLMAGWASANKFALLGALRAAAQLIAYELPLLLAVVGKLAVFVSRMTGEPMAMERAVSVAVAVVEFVPMRSTISAV